MTAPIHERIDAAMRRRFGDRAVIRNLERLTFGASAETWRFDLIDGAASSAMILRMPAPKATTHTDLAAIFSPGRDHEVAILRAVHGAGLPVAKVHFELDARDGLGEGFVMDRLAGLTDTTKVLGDPDYEGARQRLAGQLGGFRAGLNSIDTADLPVLRCQDGPAMVADLKRVVDGFDIAHPAIELGFAWLEDHLPAALGQPYLVHGDFRLANFMADTGGLTGVIDWELAHFGDPAEDLAWVCLRSWRFSRPDLAVAGVAERSVLYDAYHGAGGRPISREEIHFWEVLGTVRWAVICLYQGAQFVRGVRADLAFGAVGRRVSEPLYDLIRLIENRED
ncbi:MAG: phosphotransferase family protein [Alphaproteobacteria bacterium]|nr:phosphotransferase family protein [Alphaproteobacteria bacterium]